MCTSAFALQLSCARSLVIPDNDPQFLPLSFFSRFFFFTYFLAQKEEKNKFSLRIFNKNQGKCNGFLSEGLHLTAIFAVFFLSFFFFFVAESNSINVNKYHSKEWNSIEA